MVMVCALVLLAPYAGAQSLGDGPKTQSGPERRLIDPDNFRCIFLGDSQISSPSSARLRMQMRRWDLPIAGEVFYSHHPASGQEIEHDIDGVSSIRSRLIGTPGGWSGGGPRDFFNYRAFEWYFTQDVQDPHLCIARFRLYRANQNIAPWNTNWITTGEPLVVRIAVRTTPDTIPMIETRTLRGPFTDFPNRTVHALNREHGYQIIEQRVDTGFYPTTDGVGVAFYLPEGSVEASGSSFQIMGVAVMRTDRDGNMLPGMVIGAQAFPGWSIDDHLELTDSSRRALIDLIDANTLMVMLGHNAEPDDAPVAGVSYDELVSRWMRAFNDTGRPRPANIHVVPWMIGSHNADLRLREIINAMDHATHRHRGVLVSLFDHFDGQIPSVYNPAFYQLDTALVHPLNAFTASNLSRDLEALIFSDPSIVPQVRSPIRSTIEPPSDRAHEDERERSPAP